MSAFVNEAETGQAGLMMKSISPGASGPVAARRLNGPPCETPRITEMLSSSAAQIVVPADYVCRARSVSLGPC